MKRFMLALRIRWNQFQLWRLLRKRDWFITLFNELAAADTTGTLKRVARDNRRG